MGQSTDAILFFGYCWDEEITIASSSWHEVIAKRRGASNPWDGFTEDDDLMTYRDRQGLAASFIAEHRSGIDAWHQACRDVESEYGVSLGSHCSGECKMPMLSAWRITANRGYPLEVAQLPTDDLAEWTKMLDRWMTDLGVAPPQDKPGFWLVSDWH